MRVALVTESFLPEINGVTNSILRVVDHLEATGHEALVLAPGPGPERYARTPVVRVRGLPVPRYRSLSLGLPSPRIEATLRAFAPEVVHLASPFALGAHASSSAARLGLAMVAVYQTDVAGFLATYRLGLAARPVWRWLRLVHERAHLTLAPSTRAVADLARNGISGARVWGRGVDAARFAPSHRSAALRAELAPGGEVLVGYVGRLAAEKRVELLAALEGLPGCRVVVVGDGPLRPSLEARLPWARFTGLLSGAELSAVTASLDVFVHTGGNETFCQSAQEALAAGVPAVVPDSGGQLDFVRHGHNGLLWPANDQRGLRAAVELLAADPALRAALAARARRSVVARTWAALGTELLGHYQAALAAAGRELAA